MQFEGKVFVLAGQFKSGDKFVTATQMIEMAGGKVKDGLSISKAVSYLVLGEDGSPTWKDGVCPQIAQVELAREKGQDISVITEDVLMQALACKGVTLETWRAEYVKRLEGEKLRLKNIISSIDWKYDADSKTLTIDAYTLPDLLGMIEDAEHVGLIEKPYEQSLLPLGNEVNPLKGPNNTDEQSRLRDYGHEDMQKILPWSKHSNQIEIIYAPNLVEVPPAIFAWMPSLISINMPNVRVVGNSAFFECKALVNINIPNVITIGNGSFAHCYSLNGVVNAPRLQHIGPGAFTYCKKLTGLKTNKPDRKRVDGKIFKSTGSSLNSIGEAAFMNSENFKNISYDKKRCLVASNAFYRCKFQDAKNDDLTE